jgi:hypothetical protein
VVVMIEADEESTHVWSHKIRSTLFLSAMRHFAESLRESGWRVHYRALDVEADQTLADGLQAAVARYNPERVTGVEPGDLRVKAQIENAINSSQLHNFGQALGRGVQRGWEVAGLLGSCWYHTREAGFQDELVHRTFSAIAC